MAAAPRLATPLCDLLGLEYPLLQAGMGGVAGPELAAAVSNAGGLGIVAVGHLPPEEVRARIRQVRRLTGRPFGVNLILHPQVWRPVAPGGIPEEEVAEAQRALNRFRTRLGLAPVSDRPEPLPDPLPGALEVLLDEAIPVFSIGLGAPPPELVGRFHAAGTRVIAMAAALPEARELADAGVDAVVVQGHEAGGPRSTWSEGPAPEDSFNGTMALVPQVADAIDAPVIAAGGISDGRGVVAALALGARGAMLGTRFVATRESLAIDFYKRALCEMGSDATTVTRAYSGLPARVLRNDFTAGYAASGAPALPGYLQRIAASDIVERAAERGLPAYYPMWAGQGVGMIRDVPGAGEVMAAIVGEARDALAGLASTIRTEEDGP